MKYWPSGPMHVMPSTARTPGLWVESKLQGEEARMSKRFYTLVTLYRYRPCKGPEPCPRNSVKCLECICNFYVCSEMEEDREPRMYKLRKKRKKMKLKKGAQVFYGASCPCNSASGSPD